MSERQEVNQNVEREIEEIKESEPLSIVMEDNPEVEQLVRENPEERRKVLMAVHAEQHSGPFPPPAYLEHYESIHPGFTKESFEQMKENAAREERLVTKALDHQREEANKNRNAAMVVVLAVLLAIFVLAIMDKVVVAGGLCAVIVALAIAFLLGQKNNAFDPNKNSLDKGKSEDDTEE